MRLFFCDPVLVSQGGILADRINFTGALRAFLLILSCSGDPPGTLAVRPHAMFLMNLTCKNPVKNGSKLVPKTKRLFYPAFDRSDHVARPFSRIAFVVWAFRSSFSLAVIAAL